MAKQVDLLFGVGTAQIADDSFEVFQMLLDRQPSRIGRAVEGASRAALIKIRNKEAALQIAVEIAKERPLGAARPPMQPEQQRRAAMGPADFHI
jgi:hypothetical protein